MKIYLFELSLFKKILSHVSLCHKNFKKHFLIKVIIKNFFRQLKQHQHKIRSKTGICLEITLNVFKCLTVSLVPVKYLLWQQHHFCLFWLVSCIFIRLLWCQKCMFYCAPGRRGTLFFLKGTNSAGKSLQRFKSFSVIMAFYYGKALLNWKKHNQEI